jgi:hypothetical protein
MDEIVNKVAQSSLKVFDLEDYFPDNHVVDLDISQWLLEGFILKESDFRTQLKNTDRQNSEIVSGLKTYQIVAKYLSTLLTTYVNYLVA